MTDYSLYLVADADYAAGRDLVPLVEAAVRGGITIVQLRAKSLLHGDFLALARRVAPALKRHRVPLIINDQAEIALSCGAAGLHLGQDDLPLAVARKIMAENMIIGVSVNSPEEAREAERRGADYLGAGPVFATPTKATGLPLLGLRGLRHIKESVLIPVVAIGGITADNARSVREAGVDGIAVVSAVLGADDPQEAARRLKQSLNLATKRRDGVPSSARRSP